MRVFVANVVTLLPSVSFKQRSVRFDKKIISTCKICTEISNTVKGCLTRVYCVFLRISNIRVPRYEKYAAPN